MAYRSATLERGATRPFVFVELGAGYGHWSFAANAALRQLLPQAERRLLLVDVVDALGPTIEHLAQINGVPKDALAFHSGYISGSERLTPSQKRSAQYNQRIYKTVWATGRGHENRSSVDAAPITLRQLFRRYRLPCYIDMVDIDIQGGEYASQRAGARSSGGLLTDETVALLSSTARRVHIGLHGEAAADSELIRRFEAHGWSVTWYFPRGRNQSTPWGGVWFADGVLSLLNNGLAPTARRHGGGEACSLWQSSQKSN